MIMPKVMVFQLIFKNNYISNMYFEKSTKLKASRKKKKK